MFNRSCSAMLVVALALVGVAPTLAETLDQVDLRRLDRYLDALRAGQPGNADQVDRLADMSLPGLERTMRAYAELEEPVAASTHWAFQALLERTSRSALVPWPMIQLYSPDFGTWLTRPLDENPLAAQLFQQLLGSQTHRRAYDLAIRLTPEATLRYLREGKPEHRQGLLESWNRRLAHRRETRPIHELASLVDRVAGDCSLDLPPDLLEAHLRFVASWPDQQERYERLLSGCLDAAEPAVVLAGLAVQQHAPLLMEKNREVVERFTDQPEIRRRAIANFAYDAAHDHAATLQALWQQLDSSETKARYNCLLAMGVHFLGNDAIALAAVKENSFDYLDVAVPVLERGDPDRALQAVRHVLMRSQRGHEEALRLARKLKLTGLEEEAAAIAADRQRDQILRQTALAYLGGAPGTVRRRLLPLLAEPNGDIRLSAIQMFADPAGMTPEDFDNVGPALIQVAQHDASMGHRQEAIFALGRWRQPAAAEFFRKLLVDYPPVRLADGYYSTEHYWQYRLRLVALLGLAALGDEPARRELSELHRQGNPSERMDVLLVYIELGEVPDFAFDDLQSIEPKLVATAAHLVDLHGSDAERARLRAHFARTPLWRQFRHSGIDDHNLLQMAGLDEEPDDDAR